MTEAIFIHGYTPERVGDALELMQEMSDQEVFMLVFRGMAAATHDELVRLHKDNFVSQVDRTYQEAVDTRMFDLGWDIDTFAEQSSETTQFVGPLNNVTFELLQPGRGIDMHYDVSAGTQEGVLTIPRGFGMSINLVSPVEFQVEEKHRNLNVPDVLSSGDVERLASGASDLSVEVGEAVTVANVSAGDVVMWKQPQAHKVSVYNENRRGIAIIREDFLAVGSTNFQVLETV